MSDFSAIAAVTTTIRDLLIQEMPGLSVDEIHSPTDVSAGPAPVVNLYLYRVEHNPAAANLDWQASTATQLRAPPFGLNLHYLITPYGPDELEVQRTLGEVMRVFHERPVVRRGDPVLAGALATMTEELRIVPRMLSMSDMFDLWQAFDHVAYRLCVTYEVSTVLIDSRLTRNVQRVQERVIDLRAER